MSGGTTFDSDFVSLTQDHYLRKTVTDQIFTDHSLLRLVEERVGTDRVKGGDNILVPLGTAEDSNGGSYAGFDTFDTDPVDTLTNAVYTWAQYQQPIIANAFEVERNRSTEGVVDMWLNKTDVALKSLRSKLNTNAFGDGTGNGGKDILGLTILVDSSGTVGGIARGSNAYWSSQEVAAGGALAIDTAVGMLQLYNDCSTGSGDGATPDVAMMTQTVHQAYENLLAPDIRHISGGIGEGAFSGLAYKGMPMMWDSDATSQVMYMLNISSFEFYIHPSRDFVTTELQTAMSGHLNQDAMMQHLLVWPGFVVAESRRSGKITGVTG